MDLVEFLRARLDEDEAAARDAARCCGLPTSTTLPGSEPTAVAEGVILCGLCIHRGHDQDPAFLRHLLADLVPRGTDD